MIRRIDRREKTGDQTNIQVREDIVIRRTDRGGKTGDQTDRQGREDM